MSFPGDLVYHENYHSTNIAHLVRKGLIACIYKSQKTPSFTFSTRFGNLNCIGSSFHGLMGPLTFVMPDLVALFCCIANCFITKAISGLNKFAGAVNFPTKLQNADCPSSLSQPSGCSSITCLSGILRSSTACLASTMKYSLFCL